MRDLTAAGVQIHDRDAHDDVLRVIWWLLLGVLLPVGLLVSLVSAALLRNPRFMPARRG